MNTSGWFAPSEPHTTVTKWGSLAWLVNADLVEGAEMTVGLVTINAGMANPRHVHPNCEEIVYVVSGQCEQIVGEQRCKVGAGEGMVIPRNVAHHSINTGEEPVVVLVCYSSPNRKTNFLE